jgi:hypothetical protein
VLNGDINCGNTTAKGQSTVVILPQVSTAKTVRLYKKIISLNLKIKNYFLHNES